MDELRGKRSIRHMESNRKLEDVNLTSVIALNIHGLNNAIKEQILEEWIKKHGPNICCGQEIHLYGQRQK